jgi:hypothetical protein
MEKSFVCINCKRPVPADAPGTHHRNHCPYCLTSQHLDQSHPGDRKSPCKGIMLPLGKYYKEDGEEMLVQKCLKCGITRKNRVAGDDSGKAIKALPIINPESLN